jgi:proline iminopeptidase
MVRSLVRIVLTCFLCLNTAGSGAAQEKQTKNIVGEDVFDQLQSNVWYLKTADGKANLYVTSVGQGPLVVFLHGGPGNDFNYFVDAIRSELDHHTIILYDQRGSLLSPVPDGEIKDLKISTMVDDLDTLRKSLGKDKIAIIGHSWGSLLAMAYYSKFPEHVAGLLLIGTLPPSTPVNGSFQDLVARLRDEMKSLRNRPEVSAARKAAGLPADALNSSTELTPKQTRARNLIGDASVDLVHVDRWRQIRGSGVYYRREVDDAIGDSLEDYKYDILPVLERHPVPIDVQQGDQDFADPAGKSWRGVKEKVGFVRITVIKDAGHYAWIDAPQEFAAALGASLGRITGGNKEF